MFTLSLSNFQIHEKLDICVDGFTVVEGISSSGKSAIRRALQTLFKNEWNSSYMRSGSKSCSIVFEMDGNRVEYRRPDNSYVFNGQLYSKLGRGGVPVEFADWGFSDLEVGDDSYDVIFASQLDPLFLVSYKPADINRILGRIFDVERYKIAGQLVQKDIQSCKVSLTKAKADLNEFSSQISEYRKHLSFVSDLDDQISSLSLIDKFLGLLSIASDLDSQVCFLSEMLQELYAVSESLKSHEVLQSFSDDLLAFEQLTSSVGLLTEVSSCLSDIELGLKSVQVLSDYLGSVDRLYWTEYDFNSFVRDLQHLFSLRRDMESLGALDLLHHFNSRLSIVAGEVDMLSSCVAILSDIEIVLERVDLVCEFLGILERVSKLEQDLLSMGSELSNRISDRDFVYKDGVCPACGLPYNRSLD